MHPDDDDTDPALARRRRLKREAERRNRLLLLGGLGVVVVAACAALVAYAVSQRRQAEAALADAEKGGGRVTRPLFGGPSATSEGETWDHQELAAYLRSRGVAVHSVPTNRGSFFGPACEFREAAAAGPEVWVMKWPSQQAAKDRSGGSPQPTFAWGRFCFNGEPGTERYIESMRAALGAR